MSNETATVKEPISIDEPAVEYRSFSQWQLIWIGFKKAVYALIAISNNYHHLSCTQMGLYIFLFNSIDPASVILFHHGQAAPLRQPVYMSAAYKLIICGIKLFPSPLAGGQARDYYQAISQLFLQSYKQGIFSGSGW